MADEFAKASVLLFLFTSVSASYWNREFVKGKERFQVLILNVPQTKRECKNTCLVFTPKYLTLQLIRYKAYSNHDSRSFKQHLSYFHNQKLFRKNYERVK